MSFLKNMKIRSKMFLGFFLILAVTAFIAIYGALQINNVSREYTHVMNNPIVRRSILRDMEVAMMDARRTMNRASMHASDVYGDGFDEAANAEFRNVGITAQEQNVIRLRGELTSSLQEYRANLDADYRVSGQMRIEQNRRLDGLETAMLHYINHYILSEIMTAARAGDTEATVRITTAAGGPGGTVPQINQYFTEIREALNQSMDNAMIRLDDTRNNTLMMMILLAIAGILLGIGIALVISSIVTKPIKEVAEVVSNVSNGNFNINFRNDLSKDEVGIMTQDIYRLVNVVSDIIEDINKFAYEANDNGDIEYRIDAKKYRGGYNEMITSLNNFTDGFVKDVLSLLNVLKNVNEGNFSATLEKLPGKKVVLNQSVDELMANLNAVNREISTMVHAAADLGDLHFQLDASKYKGGWNQAMAGLNKIALAVDAPIVEIRDVMNYLSKGDFSHNVEGNYTGDFKQIKEAVNGTIETLAGYISEIADSLTRVSSGDLTHIIKREYVGSFSAIKESLNDISSSLNKTMSEISSASSQVLSGAKQISASAMDLANGASTQASSVQELTASVDLINQQTQQNAASATEANDLSVKSTENAEEGNIAMKETLDAMNRIKESSDSISKIIKGIQDISFQTNLLALNAAVEAARAGEHGRGFSVVAEEVRSLAARSQTAASETTELISNSISTVETGSDIAQSTAKSLDRIVDNANKVLGIISTISSASREQADAISQVSIGLQQISQVVQSNSAVSEETAAAAEELNSQAEILQQLVGFFTV